MRREIDIHAQCEVDDLDDDRKSYRQDDIVGCLVLLLSKGELHNEVETDDQDDEHAEVVDEDHDVPSFGGGLEILPDDLTRIAYHFNIDFALIDG